MGRIVAQTIDYVARDRLDRATLRLCALPEETGNLIECWGRDGQLAMAVDPDGKVEINGSGKIVPSNPPSGHHRVTNLYVDSGSGKLVVEYDDGS